MQTEDVERWLKYSCVFVELGKIYFQLKWQLDDNIDDNQKSAEKTVLLLYRLRRWNQPNSRSTQVALNKFFFVLSVAMFVLVYGLQPQVLIMDRCLNR